MQNQSTPSQAAEARVDAHVDQPYPDSLYRPVRTAELIPDFERLDQAAMDRYHRDGFIAIERGFESAVIEDAKAAIQDLLMGLNAEFNALLYENVAARVDLDSIDPLKRAEMVRKLTDFTHLDDRLSRVLNDPTLIDFVQAVVGEPPTCFQEMALLKPPGGGREKPWHQDHAYFDVPEGTPIVGAWIALDRARLDNGCMHAVAGSHHEIIPHHRVRDWQICDSNLDGKEILAVTLPPGGVMLFSGLLMHGTPTNSSPHKRRALQFHYVGQSVQRTATEERLALFGSEGRDAEC
ncbi:MAG: phytanoyl-CoA dioxygenase family protein [Planctomycetota bacterium]